jgi:fucose permease
MSGLQGVTRYHQLLIGSLFVVWGALHSLNDVLLPQFKKGFDLSVCGMSPPLTLV